MLLFANLPLQWSFLDYEDITSDKNPGDHWHKVRKYSRSFLNSAMTYNWILLNNKYYAFIAADSFMSRQYENVEIYVPQLLLQEVENFLGSLMPEKEVSELKGQ